MLFCPRCHKPTVERELHEYRTCEDCWVDGQPIKSREVGVKKFVDVLPVAILLKLDGLPQRKLPHISL